jgi:mannan endo-1,4-beta-mannosidase
VFFRISCNVPNISFTDEKPNAEFSCVTAHNIPKMTIELSDVMQSFSWKQLAYSVVFLSLFLISSTASAATTADPNASAKTQDVLNYLAGLPGKTSKRLVSGQWDGGGERSVGQPLQNGFTTTGYWVGLMGRGYTNSQGISYTIANPDLINYWNSGGLVSVMTFLFNPETGGQWDAGMSNFADIITPGTLAYNNYYAQLDKIAAGFQELQNAGVVVLWRPFPEMNFGWFWWGARDPATFKTAWIQMFNYFTNVKGLHNLLWVYNPNNVSPSDSASVTAYYPGAQYVDITGLDIYTTDVSPPGIGGYNELTALGKPFAFVEAGPDSLCSTSMNWMSFLNGVKQYFPKTTYFMGWFGNKCSLYQGQNVQAMLGDPWVANRGDIGSTSPSPNPTPPPSGTDCHLLDSSLSVPTDFGASFNVSSSAEELLMKAFCGSSSVESPVGNGSSYQYIYNQGYYWTGSNWTPYTYSCSNPVNGAWCVGNADYTRSMTSAEMQTKQSYLAYICNWDGTSWHCGCHDSTCSTNYWNLQQFKILIEEKSAANSE